MKVSSSAARGAEKLYGHIRIGRRCCERGEIMVDLNRRLERIEAKLELLLAEKVRREFYTIEQAVEVPDTAIRDYPVAERY